MESVSLRRIVFATYQRNPVRVAPSIHVRRKIGLQSAGFRFGIICSKKSDFQGFQDYAKPSRLLPANEVRFCTKTLLEKTLSSIILGGAQSLYKVKLQTSNIYGSSLSDLNAGILLCLIDEKGDSILERIPAFLTSAESEDMVEPEALRFQRGSVDELIFEGPQLEKLEALWISIEAGQWRLGGVSLSVITTSQPSWKGDNGENIQNLGFEYDFEVEDVLLGEGGDVSMVELRPCLVTELSGVNLSALFSKSFSQPASLLSERFSNEESMKEYTDLKYSLLLYDAVLIFVGTSLISPSIGESSGFAFSIGGIGGFLYLLLLQRSVDGLPAPELVSRNSGGNLDQKIGAFKGPLSRLALLLAISALALKYSTADVPFVLTPKDLLVGMIGFLACKVAVVLAAFKPLPLSLKERK